MLTVGDLLLEIAPGELKAVRHCSDDELISAAVTVKPVSSEYRFAANALSMLNRLCQ